MSNLDAEQIGKNAAKNAQQIFLNAFEKELEHFYFGSGEGSGTQKMAVIMDDIITRYDAQFNAAFLESKSPQSLRNSLGSSSLTIEATAVDEDDQPEFDRGGEI